MYNSLGRREKGKIAEYKVISRLIALHGMDLYAPIIDIGVDAILRVLKHRESTRYYELQIKSSPKNVSIRGAKKIIQYLDEKEPDNYFLIIAIKGKEEVIIYLTKEQIRKYAYPSTKAEKIDINVPAKDRDELINSQSLEKLITKLKS